MALSLKQRAKATAFIKKQTKLITETKRALVEAETAYAGAWKMYGSELGSDNMSQQLRAKLETYEATLCLLQSCQSGDLDISDQHDRELATKANELASALKECEQERIAIGIMRAMFLASEE